MKKGKIISILVIVAIISLLYIFNINPFAKKEKHFISYFENIGNLQASAYVLINGARVGKITNVDLAGNKIRVDFFIKDKIELPNGTVASIASADISGSKALVLTLGKSTTNLPDESVIAAKADTNFKKMFDVKITPVLHNAKSLLYHTDSAMQGFNKMLHGNLGKEINTAITDFHDGMYVAAKLTANITPTINDAATTLRELGNVIDNPIQKNKSINEQIDSVNNQLETISRKDLSKDFKELNTHLNKLSKNFSKLGRESKLLNSKKEYTDANEKIDSFTNTVKVYQQNPPALIKIP